MAEAEEGSRGVIQACHVIAKGGLGFNVLCKNGDRLMPESAKRQKSRTLVVETRTAPVTEAAKNSAAAVSTAEGGVLGPRDSLHAHTKHPRQRGRSCSQAERGRVRLLVDERGVFDVAYR